MDSFISLSIIFLLFFIQIKLFKDMCKYLASTYSEEWEKLSESSMGGSKWSVINANLSESLNNGFFSTISDDKVTNFLMVRKYIMYVMAGIIFLQFVMAYLK